MDFFIMETWKDVPNYYGLYQVSDLGRVKSLRFNKELILKLETSTKNYFICTLYKNKKAKRFYVHQLVSMAFLNHTPNGITLVVNHKNFNRKDNRLENLEVVKNRENTNQKHLKSTSKYTGVSWNKHAKKWVSGIHINGKRKYLGCFDNELDAYYMYENALKNLLDINVNKKPSN